MASTSSRAQERNRGRRPGFLLAMEGPRSFAEFGATLAALPILALAPRGHGEPVLVLPGLGAGERSTFALRRFLSDKGYRPYDWGLGRNRGRTREVLAGVERLLRTIKDEHGQPASIIGWSLGGVYAREIAERRPELVRQVITMGSPHRLFRRGRRRPDGPVPVTAIYSRSDGVVSWESCLEDTAKRRENIEVFGSHFGFGHNPAVLWVVADRLAQDECEWRPYRTNAFARAV